MDILLKIVAFSAGLGLVVLAVSSAVQTFVLPRAASDVIVRVVFRNLRRLFNLAMRPARTRRRRASSSRRCCARRWRAAR